jgi:hypothetical protein
VVIFVHGTRAAAAEDHGQKWWQSGSPVAWQLASRLPGSIDVAPPSLVFHWTGENGERARSKAASELMAFVRPLEAAGKPYHLVGHSHGGSVIWNMLKLATICRYPLANLRTWTTVGTPFLQHQGRNPWNPVNVLLVLIGLILLRPAFRAFHHLGTILWNAAVGNREGFVFAQSEAKDLDNPFEYPIISILRFVGIQATETAGGVQIGSYDPGVPVNH